MNPRSHRTYQRNRATYLAEARSIDAPCCLCGGRIAWDLPGTHPLGPTIEHRIPVRTLRTQARTRTDLLDLVCDTRWWGVAHQGCQTRQGGRSTRERSKAVTMSRPSRAW